MKRRKRMLVGGVLVLVGIVIGFLFGVISISSAYTRILFSYGIYINLKRDYLEIFDEEKFTAETERNFG